LQKSSELRFLLNNLFGNNASVCDYNEFFRVCYCEDCCDGLSARYRNSCRPDIMTAQMMTDIRGVRRTLATKVVPARLVDFTIRDGEPVFVRGIRWKCRCL